MRWSSLLFVAFVTSTVSATAAAPVTPRLAWKKTQIDKVFRSEGVAVADVNRDGKADVLVGDVWYEAPNWKMHPIRKVGDYGDGSAGYSQCFACWADDLNGDGWPDLIVVGFPGKDALWYENPKGKPGPWKEHVIWPSACNETPLYVDLFNNGKRVLVMGAQPPGKENEGQMGWFEPGNNPADRWIMHPISPPSTPGKPVPGTFKYAHGLGVGDINGDRRLDVIVPAGWWEQPASAGDQPWTFHAAALGDPCADMFAYDVDGDGKADVISSAAHKTGIWWHQHKAGPNGEPSFIRQDLFPRLVSQTHALHCVDLNGDGLKDLVTGKRWWAHGPKGDDDPMADPKLYWFEARKHDGVVHFTPHVIDDASGIGTQFSVVDANGDGLLDIVTSNKRGVHLFEQVRSGVQASDWKPLFNGRDLAGWDTWLGRPKAGEPIIGLNTDPNKVYSVVDVDGQPAIRISGQNWGAITTHEEFENYHLRLEFKWGDKRWPPREKTVRDSGLLYHCVGPQGAHGTFWMQSLEFQIQEHDTGDFWSVASAIVDVKGERKNDKAPIVFNAGGSPFTVPTKTTGYRIVKSGDYEKPTGLWNVLDLYVLGGTSVHVVNGRANMVLTNARRKEGDSEVPLKRGKIQLQSEAAEVFYRQIAVRPISAIPQDILR